MGKKTNIIVNALQYKTNGSGISVNLRELYGRYVLISDWPCQVFIPEDSPDFPASKFTRIIRIPCRYSQSLRRIWFQSFCLGRQCCDSSIILTTDSKIPFLLPRRCQLITLITDLAVYRMPEVYQRSRVLWWKLQYMYLRKRANLFLTVSESTKRDIEELFGVSEEKIRVIPCAYSEKMTHVSECVKLDALKTKYNLPGKYILFVGNFNPRKNLRRIIQAFDSSNVPHALVIAGEQGWKFNKSKVLKNVKRREDIFFTGFVTDEDMPALYSAADLFVFPTLYEGFGVPILEAQACGVPVLTGNNSSLPEVGGNGAIYVDSYDVDEIRKGIEMLVNNEEMSKELVQRGYQNIKRFSWDESAQKLKNIVDEIAAARGQDLRVK